MKLLRSLEGLERKARGIAPRGARVGLVWTDSDVRLGRLLAPGEFIAVDVHVTGVNPGSAETMQWRTEERATTDPRDLGVVYDCDGVRIGRVVRRDGSLFTTKLDARRAGS